MKLFCSGCEIPARDLSIRTPDSIVPHHSISTAQCLPLRTQAAVDSSFASLVNNLKGIIKAHVKVFKILYIITNAMVSLLNNLAKKKEKTCKSLDGNSFHHKSMLRKLMALPSTRSTYFPSSIAPQSW